MIDLSKVEHHPAIKELVGVICQKTQNADTGFYPIAVAYFLGKMASSMRTTVLTKDRGNIPVSIYALALATSGSGKGYSVGIFETEVMKKFKHRFMTETFPTIADQHLWKLAIEKAVMSGLPEAEEYEKISKEFAQTGALSFTFDSGTAPAIKQMRQKLLMANLGAINLQIDEIGSNLINSTEVLNVFLELYDKGTINSKLTKNTHESQRGTQLEGTTPANMLLFGTPAKLLDGASIEDTFYSFLDTGYARRCFFGIGNRIRIDKNLSAAELYQRMLNPTHNATIQKWADHFYDLADPSMFDWKVDLPDNVAIELLEYKLECERIAEELPEHEEILKAEMSHRYFKLLRLAGTFAFVDQAIEVSMDHLYQAMKLTEESGECFKAILRREKTYVRLARFLADVGTPQTHTDLLEQLPFYPRSGSGRNDLMSLAQAWAHRNHIVIRKNFVDGIELYSGEKLAEVDLEKITISYSKHPAYGFSNENVPWSKLDILFNKDGYGFTNHHAKRNHRAEENMIPGFDILVLDVDAGPPIPVVQKIMMEYSYWIYTTKRHDDNGQHRYRLLMPMNYRLKLDSEDYKKFMENVLEWLPFSGVDDSANQRSRKWSCNLNTKVFSNIGKAVDILPFIPKTAKNDLYKNQNKALGNLNNLERWFAERIAMGNRNNRMIEFALALLDSGIPSHEVETMVFNFNAKLPEPLSEAEIRGSILITVAKKAAAK